MDGEAFWRGIPRESASGMDGWVDPLSDERARYIICPDSMSSLEPRIGDVLYSRAGCGVNVEEMLSEERAALASYIIRRGGKIIQRDGKPFMWPEGRAMTRLRAFWRWYREAIKPCAHEYDGERGMRVREDRRGLVMVDDTDIRRRYRGTGALQGKARPHRPPEAVPVRKDAADRLGLRATATGITSG